MKKQCEALELKMKVLSKENESAKADISTLQSNITDLQEQVRIRAKADRNRERLSVICLGGLMFRCSANVRHTGNEKSFARGSSARATRNSRQSREYSSHVSSALNTFRLSRKRSATWTKVSTRSLCPSLSTHIISHVEIEDNAREVEHDLRESIDLMQNQLREVGFPSSTSSLTISPFRKNDRSNNFNTPSAITNGRS